jgi:hypothetical protein
MTGAELAAVKTAVTVVNIADRHGLFGRLRNKLARKNYILLLGSTGAGKTQFIASLKAVLPEVISRMDRTERSKDTVLRLGKQVFVLVDTPGQKGHSSQRMLSLLRLMNKRPVGVINVVAYGYHEYRTGTDEAIDENQEVKAQWLEDHRKIEIDTMRDWVSMVSSTAGWMLTLVTKADLWWADRESVYLYYATGPYAQALSEYGLQAHTVREYSSVQHPFYDLAPTSGSFSQTDRTEIQQRLFRYLLHEIAKA